MRVSFNARESSKCSVRTYIGIYKMSLSQRAHRDHNDMTRLERIAMHNLSHNKKQQQQNYGKNNNNKILLNRYEKYCFCERFAIAAATAAG